MEYVEVIVNVPQMSGRASYDYHVPAELEGKLERGHLVVVPFGRQQVQGVVLRRLDQPSVPDTRPVAALLSPDAAITPAQLALAEVLAEETLAPLSAYINLMLPPGLSQLADTLYTVYLGVRISGLTNTQTRLVALLEENGPMRGRQIDRQMGKVDWRKAAESLARRRIIEKTAVLPPPTIKPKRVRTVRLTALPEEVEKSLETLGRQGSLAQERRQRIMQHLLHEARTVDVAWVYAQSGGNLQDLKFLSDKGLVELGSEEVWRDPLEEMTWVPASPPSLTPDQEEVWGIMQQSLEAAFSQKNAPKPILLHGVTGSGKTEIYLRAVEKTLHSGQQAIVMVPEIALTPQTVRRFMSRFPGQVGLVHSGLSPGERYDTWRRARDGLLPVIVGPRSALFSPLPNLGLIVVDECHDSSYYQSEFPPTYHAVEAAVLYAQIAGAVCLMGSATPSVESYYLAQAGTWQLAALPRRILAHKEQIRAHLTRWGGASRYRPFSEEAETTDLPDIHVVDMRQELKAGNRSIFSRNLVEALGNTLERGEQSILFLNRRGTATYVFCRDCGYSVVCPRCEKAPLTYHQNLGGMMCHHCGYQRQMPKKCPACGSTRIRQFGTGTERVEQEVQEMFPGVRTLRWDWETTRAKGSHDIILSHFTNHRADVLVGTQMLAKGLDLPLVTLVGVMLADVGMQLPDFRAGERTFQVLSQVSGRAGRSPLSGRVVLQTFNPDHYVIKAVAAHDYEGFYQQELAYRQTIGYPPFSCLVRLEYRHTNAQKVADEAARFAEKIREWLGTEGRKQTEIVGPVPCFYGRLDGQTRWQIIVRGPDPASFLRGRVPPDWRIEVQPQSLL